MTFIIYLYLINEGLGTILSDNREECEKVKKLFWREVQKKREAKANNVNMKDKYCPHK